MESPLIPLIKKAEPEHSRITGLAISSDLPDVWSVYVPDYITLAVALSTPMYDFLCMICEIKSAPKNNGFVLDHNRLYGVQCGKGFDIRKTIAGLTVVFIISACKYILNSYVISSEKEIKCPQRKQTMSKLHLKLPHLIVPASLN
jgi:hypothetical protein